jgi:hypothetical protein
LGRRRADQVNVVAMSYPIFFAALALGIAGAAYSLARRENDKGQYWAALVSGMMAMVIAWTAGYALLKTDIAQATYYVGVFVSLRIALEIGFSFSAIVCRDELQ